MATVTKGRTFVSGETVTPAKLNDVVDLATVTAIVNADVSASAAIALTKLANGPAFSAYAGTTTTAATSVFTKVTLNTERFDTDNRFTNSRFTPNVAGYYQINGSVSSSPNANYLLAAIVKNATSFNPALWDDGWYGNYSNAVTPASSVSALVYLNGTTDYVELAVYHQQGTNVSVAAGADGTRLDGFLARAA